MATVFDRDTAVEALGDGRFAAVMSETWWGGGGPHGGFIAAILMRTMLAMVDDPGRPPRSVTFHYARAPKVGPVEIEITLEKAGRQASTLTARLSQDGRVAVVALATFSASFPGRAAYAHGTAPAHPRPTSLPRDPERSDIPNFARHFDMRPLPGTLPYSGAERPLAGGWIRLAEPHLIDAPLVALIADAFWPAPYATLPGPVPAPTIDLTIHFRRSLPLPADDDPYPFVLTQFTSSTSHEGFFEEDGEVWAADGTLIAQSRQLALLL
jgi:acyl-CoA thioesterase